ncbi:MAG: hypothetical protein ABI607_13970, partial [Betaproteobacteria bacterium]
ALHILRIIQEEAMKENTAQVVAQMPVDVATFLLNEKRTDVLTIETRFKVNVLLVPNRHLETPNYSIERLRHEDLNQSEPLPLSFDMVKQPEQVDLARQKKDEATAPPRQEAVVKGITPTQPAPIPVERPAVKTAPAASGESNWLSRMMGWFTTKPEAPAAAPAPARREGRSEGRNEDRPRDGRRDSRNGDNRDRKRGDSRNEIRGEGRNEGRRGGEQRDGQADSRNRRDGRDQRGEKRGENKNEARSEQKSEQKAESARQGQQRDGKPQGEARRDGNRPPREPRESAKTPREPRAQPTSDEDTVINTVEGAASATPQNGAGAEARDGNRRRRGRRGRGGDRPDSAGASGENGAVTEENESAPSVVDTLSMVAAGDGMPADDLQQPPQEVKAPREPRPPREPRQPREAREQREPRPPREPSEVPTSQLVPAVSESIVSESIARTTAPLFADAPVAAAPIVVEPAEVARVAAPPTLPTVAMTLPADSGLELVETRFDAPAQAGELPETPRPKRVRPPRVEVAAEPLEIIETRKDSPPPAN